MGRFFNSIKWYNLVPDQMHQVVTAQWYDPTNNTYQPVTGSPFANSGTVQVSLNGQNAEGATDWVLLLTVQ